MDIIYFFTFCILRIVYFGLVALYMYYYYLYIQ